MSEEDLRAKQQATQRDLDDLHRKFDETYSGRMQRIEKKLDELTTAVVSIARAEEKIVTLIEDTQEIKNMVNSHTNRIHQTELDVSRNTSNLKTLYNLFWTISGAVITVLIAIGISSVL